MKWTFQALFDLISYHAVGMFDDHGDRQTPQRV